MSMAGPGNGGRPDHAVRPPELYCGG
jgi:hypothetical protein